MVDSIDAEAIKDDLYHLIVKKNLSQSSLRQAKGHKDRYAILSGLCLKQLENTGKYISQNTGSSTDKKSSPLSIRAIQHAFENAKKAASMPVEIMEK